VRGQLDQALAHARQALALAQAWGQKDSALIAGLLEARILRLLGDLDGAQAALELCQRLAQSLPGYDRCIAANQAGVRLAQGNLAAVERWATESGLDVSAPQTERGEEQRVLARLLIAQERYSEALAVLSALERAEQTSGSLPTLLETLALQTAALLGMGSESAAYSTIRRALALAETEGFVLPFTDAGAAVAQLAQRVTGGAGGRLAERLMQAALPAVRPGARPAPSVLVEPLSAREIEVLALMAQGLSNDEIARRLVLSLSTVKWHSANIYGKLGVKNRTEAAARARSLSILPAS
jgi:LuxR family maltose regulon positive regulatory protein